MKKITLLFISLLSLCACNTKGGKNTNVVEQSKYRNIYVYDNVSYSFDQELRCVVHYIRWNEQGDIAKEKEWCVYLTGFYVIKGRDWNTFYECEKTTNSYDYYLIVY